MKFEEYLNEEYDKGCSKLKQALDNIRPQYVEDDNTEGVKAVDNWIKEIADDAGDKQKDALSQDQYAAAWKFANPKG